MTDTHDERGGDEDVVTPEKAAFELRYWLDTRTGTDRLGRDVGIVLDALAAVTARAETAEARVPQAFASGWADAIAAFRAPGWDQREAAWRKYREEMAADAAQDGPSEPVERSEASGGSFQGNTSSITPQGLSEAEGGCPWCGTLQKLDADGLVLPHEHPTYCDECPGSTRRPNNDTPEDGQHG